MSVLISGASTSGMRILTVRQPWAWAIFHGGKDVEGRGEVSNGPSIELRRPQTESVNSRRGLTLNQGLVDWRAAVQSTESEVWKPVLGYEDYYEVSDRGRVRSLPRTATRRGKGPVPVAGKVLSAYTHTGYPAVNLCVNGSHHRKPIHILVCEAWYGPCPEGLECRHLDDDKSNATPANLRWGTRSENMHDRIRNGIDPNRRKTHCPRDHEYTPENTHISPDGRRYCRTCMRIWDRAHKDRKGLAA